MTLEPDAPGSDAASERHRRVAELFEQAVELPQDRWQSFVESACGQDLDLLRRVTALLEAERKAPESFMAQPALHMTAKQLVDKAALLTGTQLGNYLVGNQVGAGGMGTVYEARDIRLDRKVAIKVLPPAFVEDPDRVGRFRKEARAVSLLNHPNIVSIYDAELDRGRYYIATEFVEGKTLRQMVAEGPADPKQLIEIATQICSALAAAHEAGIVHRDIKPENIMVRPDGIVKVLDFGLAKLREPVSGESTPGLETRPGNIAGTLQYLAPEQVTGKPTGPRSDLFSLGVVLYELAAGVRPFRGATDGAIFAAILLEIPAFPMQLRPSIDRELDSLIMRAIEKDPDLRFQSASDMRAALRLLARGSLLSAGAPEKQQQPPHPTRLASKWKSPRVVALAAGGVAIGVLAAGLWLGWTGSRILRPALPVKFERLTDMPGEEIFPNLSSDGKQFFYSGSARGKWDIYLQRTGGANPVNLTESSKDDDTEPALSPAGDHIAFRSERDGGGLFVMEATGENLRRISSGGFLPAWSPDGKSIVYCNINFASPSSRMGPVSRLHIIDLATGAERRLETADAMQPNWSPHGYRIAYWGIRATDRLRDIFTASADSGAPVEVTNDAWVDWNPVWSPSGDYLYFISDRGGSMNLWRVAIDERTGKTRGDPEPVTVPTSSLYNLAFAADGRSFAYAEAHQRNILFSIGYDPVRQAVTGDPEIVGNGAHRVSVFSFSPDEQRIVHDEVGEVQEDLWIMNRDGSGRRRLMNDSFKDRSPAWSPTGDRIVFMSDRLGRYEEWTIRPDGSELRRLTNSTTLVQRPVWTPDGKQVLASRLLMSPELLDAAPPVPQPDRPSLPGLDAYPGALFSPFPARGSLLTAEWNTSEKGWELLFYDLSTGKAELPGIPGRRPAWMPQGQRQVLLGRGSKCMLYDLDTKRERELFSVAPNTLYEIHATGDGRRIYFSETIRDADLWLARMGK